RGSSGMMTSPLDERSGSFFDGRWVVAHRCGDGDPSIPAAASGRWPGVITSPAEASLPLKLYLVRVYVAAGSRSSVRSNSPRLPSELGFTPSSTFPASAPLTP